MTQNNSDSVTVRELPLLDNHKLPNIGILKKANIKNGFGHFLVTKFGE